MTRNRDPFDAFEVGLVAEFADTDGSTYPERVSGLDEGWEDEAHGTYWTVWGHRGRAFGDLTGDVTDTEGLGATEIRDFEKREDALDFAYALADGKPVYED